MDDEDAQNKEAQACSADIKEPADKKPAWKNAKATSAENTSSLASKQQVQGRWLSPFEIEPYSDFHSLDESGEESKGILTSITENISEHSGAAANVTNSTSDTILDDIVYAVSHEDWR